MGSAKCLVHVLDRETGRLGELFLRRLTAKLHLEAASRTGELLLPLDDVNRTRIVRAWFATARCNRLADPPRRIRRELEPTAPVELLDRAVEPSVPSWMRSRNGTPRPR